MLLWLLPLPNNLKVKNMFSNQQSVPRNPLVGFILNITTVMLLLTPFTVAAVELTEYCDIKTEFATQVFNERDSKTKDEVLNGLEADWRLANRITPWYIVVDLKRIVNDVYRTNRLGEYRMKDSAELLNDTNENCTYYGF